MNFNNTQIFIHSYSDNNNSNDHYDIGIKYFNEQNYKKAIEYLEWFIKQYKEAPKNIVSDACFYIGLAYQYTQEYALAIDYFFKSIANDAKCKNSHFSYAQIGNCYLNYYNSNNDLDSAIYYYKKALENPLSERYSEIIYTQIGNCYFHKGENDTAIEWYHKAIDRAIEQNFYYPDVYNYIGNLHFNKKNYKLAIEYYNVVVKLFSWHVQYTYILYDSITYKSYAIPNYYSIGNAYLYEKEYDRAIEYYNRTLDFSNDVPYEYNLSIGEVYFNKKDYGEAIKYFHKIDSTLDSSNINMLLFIANTYFWRGFYDKAIYYYEKALEIDTINVDAHLFIGYAYFNKLNYDKSKPNYDKAIYYCEKALEIDPFNKDVLRFIGYIYFVKQNYDRAVNYYDKVTKLGNTNIETYLYTAASYYNKQNNEKTKNYDRVILHCKEVLKLDSINIDAHLLLGEAYFLKGKNYYDEASIHYQKAIDNFQKNTFFSTKTYAKIYRSMGDYLRKTKYQDNAIKCFQIVANFENKELKEWFKDNKILIFELIAPNQKH